MKRTPQTCFAVPRYRIGLVKESTQKYTQMMDSDDVYKLFQTITANLDREVFLVATLDSKNVPIGVNIVHVGTLNMSLVCPRDVFKLAILQNASSIIVGHNHPSGDPTASPEDIEVTMKLQEVGVILDIPVLDSLIIGDGKHVSLKKEGWIQ